MAGPMLPRERADFSAIVDRPPLKLPGGARIVFWTIVNYEVWDIGKPMARQVLPAPTGQVLIPDVPNWSWHEYGMRVGAWRFFELFGRLGIKPTLSINARVCEDYSRVAEQAKRDGWEFMGLTQTLETPDLLAAAGIKYIGDWVYDDEPTTIRTANGPLVTLPYSVELNDIPMTIVQHHQSDYLAKRAIDQFDRLYAEGKERAKIMALAIHPYISGQPHRIKYLEAIYQHVARFDGVLHWNGVEILEWYSSAIGMGRPPGT
jgi:allantoinase